METKASLRGARLSAQKGRLVADLIRGKPVEVKTIFVERGMFLKRFQARAKGRGNRVLKHSCHIFITVGD